MLSSTAAAATQTSSAARRSGVNSAASEKKRNTSEKSTRTAPFPYAHSLRTCRICDYFNTHPPKREEGFSTNVYKFLLRRAQDLPCSVFSLTTDQVPKNGLFLRTSLVKGAIGCYNRAQKTNICSVISEERERMTLTQMAQTYRQDEETLTRQIDRFLPYAKSLSGEKRHEAYRRLACLYEMRRDVRMTAGLLETYYTDCAKRRVYRDNRQFFYGKN